MDMEDVLALQNRIKDLEEENKELKSELLEVKQDLDQEEHENSKWSNEFQDAQETIENLEKQIDDLEEKTQEFNDVEPIINIIRDSRIDVTSLSDTMKMEAIAENWDDISYDFRRLEFNGK